MTFRLEHPEWLWLAALLPVMWLAGWRWMRAMSGLRRITALAARTALMLLLALALAGVTSVRTTDRLAVVAVVDVSGSVRAFAPERLVNSVPRSALEQARGWLKRAAGQRGPDDLVGVVVFDGDSAVIATPRPGRARGESASVADSDQSDVNDPLDRPFDVVMRDGTDIAAAIDLAQAIMPSDAARRIVLFSDGNQTTGDALAAARVLAGARTQAGSTGTPIDVVPFTYDVENEVLVESVDVPSRAPAGATVTARVRLWSAAETRGLLRLQVEGRDVPIGDGGMTAREVTLSPGANTIIVNVPLDAGRVHRFTAIYEPLAPADPISATRPDRLEANNRAEGVTITPGAGTILLLDGYSNAGDGPGSTLPATLRREGLDVEVVAPDGLSADLLALEKYDLVMMHNVPASLVPSSAQDALVRYVTELGGGLVMIGGPEAFGAGGWKGSAVEPVLPVRLDLPEKMIVASAAVVIVMDTSGSMGLRVLGGSRTQQEIANEGAAVAIRSLDKTDLVGVIQFDNDASTVVPLSKNEDPEANAQAVLRLGPGGGTNLPPALRLAWDQMKGGTAQVRHVIVLSDGRSQNSEQVPFIAEQMLKEGIKVSAIAVGDMADVDGLRDLARKGGGTFYRVTDPNLLPRLFLKAVQVIRTPMIREQPFVPVVQDGSSPLIAGLDTSRMPPLDGLVLTTAKGGTPGAAGSARLPAGLGAAGVTYALISDKGEPLLAHWQAGLGQVAAFTSDAAVWAKQWIEWPGYGQLWVQVARTTSRPSVSRSIEMNAQVVGDEVKVRLDAFDDAGRAKDGLAVTGAVYTPSGQRHEVRLTQTGPGVYEGAAPASESGTYVVTLTPSAGAEGSRLPPVIGAATRPVGGEVRDLQSNVALLAQVAAATGGRVLSLDVETAGDADLFNRRGVQPQEARLPLWPLVLPVAAIVLWLDIGTRRIAWDRLLSREFGASLVADASAATRERGVQATGTLGSLRRRDAQIEASARADAGRALSGAEARAVAAAAKVRRAAERAATAGGGGSAPGTPPSASTRPSVPSGEGASGLAAAKRRAREKFDQ